MWIYHIDININIRCEDERRKKKDRICVYICYATLEKTSMTHIHTNWAHSIEYNLYYIKSEKQKKKREKKTV